jgi:choline dehydrogenase-like flavoprotein
MIVDACTIPDGEALESDVVIVGAGAAGLALALELQNASCRIAVLAGGGMAVDRRTQQLLCSADEVSAGYWPPTVTRLRCFGGSTAKWSGSCRPLDPIDFARRSDVPDSGWPFPSAHLEPYYRRAQKICGLGPLEYSAERWGADGPPPLPLVSADIRSAVFQINPPVDFGVAYQGAMAAARDTTVFLHAHVVGIETTETGSEVRRLRVACLNGPRFTISGRLFVLAAGGIENPRLLLNATEAEPHGLGNRYDLVGRYFMDHPKVWKAGRVTFTRSVPLEFYDYHWVDGTRIHGIFTPSEESIRKRGVPNFAICLDRASAADVSPGVASLRALRRRYLRARSAGADWGELRHHLRRIATDVGGVMTARWRSRQAAQNGRLFSTRYWCDCPPDRDSRITLSPKVDGLGVRRARIDWRLPADFAHHMALAHDFLNDALREIGVGVAQLNTAEDVQDPAENVENSYHHMGATRMHENPKHGVVGPDGRVHGTANLYIAGSSVFPTYGQANPTLTIVALTARLADHLKTAMDQQHPKRWMNSPHHGRENAEPAAR